LLGVDSSKWARLEGRVHTEAAYWAWGAKVAGVAEMQLHKDLTKSTRIKGVVWKVSEEARLSDFSIVLIVIFEGKILGSYGQHRQVGQECCEEATSRYPNHFRHRKGL